MNEDNQEVSAGWETLLRQASITAEVYFQEAVAMIDSKFGEGYAKKHPELVGAFMNAAARDFASSSQVVAAQKITSALYYIASRIRGQDKIDMG